MESRISAFIQEQRFFSDDLQNSPPKSVDSADELQQVVVDPERGLILNTNLEDMVVDAKKVVKSERAATVRLKSSMSQSLITGYFRSTFKKIQTGFAAANAAHVASQASSVSTNGKQDIQTCEDDFYVGAFLSGLQVDKEGTIP